MTEPEATPTGSAEKPEEPTKARPRRLRRILWAAAGIATLLVASTICLYFWASSAGFENLVRKWMIAKLETVPALLQARRHGGWLPGRAPRKTEVV